MGAWKRAPGWSLSTSGSSTKLLPRSLDEEVSSSTTNSLPACTREATPKSRSSRARLKQYLVGLRC